MFVHLGKWRHLADVLEHFCSRYAIIVNDNKVKKVFAEPDGVGLTCSLSQNALDAIKKGDLAK